MFRSRIPPIYPFAMLATACSLVALQSSPPPPSWLGDPEGPRLLGADLESAFRSSEAFGPMPRAAWSIHVHQSDVEFERATGAPPQRFASWVGDTLHLRPLEKIRRRDLGAMLRHELVHRRLAALKLRPWEEEARCLFAEGHPAPPNRWPKAPDPATQTRLDLALRRGTTASQAWAYGWLRAWIAGRPLPNFPRREEKKSMKNPWFPDR